ncbi:MAG TPA: hypothetical protein VJV77_11195 [Casimicrobiaceae bacterium]|nr:hypothetical protein [Casimicrobiaceae bacterium]
MQNLFRALIACFAVSLAAPAAAQAGEWHIAPYAWLAGFDGTAGITGAPGSGGRVDVDTGFGDIKQAGAMVNLGWRGGRFSAFGDWTYANVKTDAPTPFTTLYAGADAKISGNIVEANGGYDLLGTPGTSLDIYGGVRYYDLDIDLSLREGLLPGVGIGKGSNWVDGVVGVRWQTRFTPNWEAYATADVGAGGSDLAWQLLGVVGYRFSWGTVFAGWRHLHVKYEKDSFKLDAALTGPLVGASFRF